MALILRWKPLGPAFSLAGLRCSDDEMLSSKGLKPCYEDVLWALRSIQWPDCVSRKNVMELHQSSIQAGRRLKLKGHRGGKPRRARKNGETLRKIMEKSRKIMEKSRKINGNRGKIMDLLAFECFLEGHELGLRPATVRARALPGAQL